MQSPPVPRYLVLPRSCTVYTYIKQGATPLHKHVVGCHRVGPAQMNSEQQHPPRHAQWRSTSTQVRDTYTLVSRSRWPRVLRRGSAAVRLLGLRVRTLPVSWMSVSCEYCVFAVRSLCVGLIARPEESYRVCVCLCISVISCRSNHLYLDWIGRKRSD
jgi:hypothetical protein